MTEQELAEIARLKAENARLREENERYRQALHHYAILGNWSHFDTTTGPRFVVWSGSYQGSQIAATALQPTEPATDKGE